MKPWLAAALAVFLVRPASPAGAPDVRVVGRTILSERLPRVRVRVADSIRYLGEHPIRIRDVAAGKRLVFAEVGSGGRVRRMVIAQFEGFLPGVEDLYRYRFDGAPTFGGLPFRTNGFASSTRAEMKENPGSEVEATMRFLADKRVEAPDELAIYRFVTIGDSTRKTEMIVFYMQPLADFGTTYAAVAERLPESILTSLAARAVDAVSIEAYPPAAAPPR